MLTKQQNKTILGFSLVELLVVISIIGVLSAVLVANFMGARERARDAQKIQDLNSIKNALRMYYNDHQTYPDGEGANACLDCLSSKDNFSSYLPAIASLNLGYSYTQTGNGDGFQLWIPLESGSGDEDVHSQQKCNYSPVRDKVFMVCAN